MTLNQNEQAQDAVTRLNMTDGIVLYQYHNTTFEDDNTRIVCAAGADQGVIHITVFCK